MINKISVKIFIISFLVLITGLVLSPIAKNYSESRGGSYIIAKKINSNYFLINDFEEKVEISKKEYLIQNFLAIFGSLNLVVGSILIFKFFINLIIYSVKNRDKFN